MSAFTVVSTFSGCGGSSLGYQQAGGKVLLAVEWDANAVATYRLNFPDTPIYHGDIKALSVADVLARTGLEPGELDIFDGSPPCQGFSTAGKRDFGDERNQLFREYVRLLRGLRPRVFVMENVSGMVKGKMKLIFAECLRELKASGYRVKARLLNAMYFGVPQSRQRMIFVGVREDLDVEPSHPKGQTRPVTVGEALANIKPKTLARPLAATASRIWQTALPGQSGQHLAWTGGKYFNSMKVDPSRPSPCLIKVVSGCGGMMHWAEPRTLSIEEAAAIHSFPPEHRFVGKHADAWQRIGNSVPPRFMQAIAEHIRDNILHCAKTGRAPEVSGWRGA